MPKRSAIEQACQTNKKLQKEAQARIDRSKRRRREQLFNDVSIVFQCLFNHLNANHIRRSAAASLPGHRVYKITTSSQNHVETISFIGDCTERVSCKTIKNDLINNLLNIIIDKDQSERTDDERFLLRLLRTKKDKIQR